MRPSDEKSIDSHKKNRTPDAERKWRKRHGLPSERRQGQRGQGKTVRSDRQEACRRVAEVLVREPLATVRRLAELAFGPPEKGGDEKTQKKVHERTRRALADLARKTWLAGDLADQVRAALAAREAAAERARQERERLKAEQEARRREREKRFRLQPARVLMKRLLKQPEVAAEISRIVTARRRFALAGQEEERDMWWLFPKCTDQGPADVTIWHPAPGIAGQVVTSAGATWVANRELAVQRAVANMLSIPWQAARDILTAARKLRRAAKKEDIVAEAAARRELKLLVRRALAAAAPVDPAEWAGQYSAEIVGINAAALEMAAAKEAGLWPLPGVADVSTPAGNGWPEPWTGKTLDAPDGDCRELEQIDDDDGIDQEISEIFTNYAVILAGGRRRSKKNGAKTSTAERAAAQEGLHPAM